MAGYFPGGRLRCPSPRQLHRTRSSLNPRDFPAGRPIEPHREARTTPIAPSAGYKPAIRDPQGCAWRLVKRAMSMFGPPTRTRRSGRLAWHMISGRLRFLPRLHHVKETPPTIRRRATFCNWARMTIGHGRSRARSLQTRDRAGGAYTVETYDGRRFFDHPKSKRRTITVSDGRRVQIEPT